MIDNSTLRRLWPGAPQPLIDCVAAQAPAVFAARGLNTPLRVAHFMAQISHESDGGRIREESLNYKTPARIAAVWPSRFTAETAAAFVGKPRELANKVYNGRMGNRAGSDDGWNFRGRGLLQLTGRDSYAKVGGKVGLDLAGNPDLISDPAHALEIAACEFVDLNCLPAADKDDLRLVTRRVNGGYNGLDSRSVWLKRWKQAIPDLPDALPADDEPDGAPRGGEPDKPAMVPPVEAKPLRKSRTIWGGLLSYAGTVASAVAGFFDRLDNPYTLTAFLAVLALGAVGLWMVLSGRLNVQKLVDQLSEDA